MAVAPKLNAPLLRPKGDAKGSDSHPFLHNREAELAYFWQPPQDELIHTAFGNLRPFVGGLPLAYSWAMRSEQASVRERERGRGERERECGGEREGEREGRERDGERETLGERKKEREADREIQRETETGAREGERQKGRGEREGGGREGEREEEDRGVGREKTLRVLVLDN